MRQIKIKKTDNSPETISQIVSFLKGGQVVVMPTDTIYGFSCRADDGRAIKRIFRLKSRSVNKPFIVLVSSLAMAKKYAFISGYKEDLARKYWQNNKRPTTIIFKHRGLLPKELTGGRDGLALRLPKSDFLIKIIKKINRPLVSTSLNLSGEADIFNLADIALNWPDKNNQPDVVINTGQSQRKKPSRLIDFSGTISVVIRK